MVELGGREAVEAARRGAAAAAARLAAACVAFAEERIETDRQLSGASTGDTRTGRPRPGEFVADEVSLLLREQPWTVRCLLARTRRLQVGLPTVWSAYLAGHLDAEQVRIIDRVARRVAEPHTLAAIDERVVEAAQTRPPKRLATWLLRLVVGLEPLQFEQRHRKALAERRVTIVQGADGIGYVTGEVSAADAAAIDAMLAAAARSLGAEDPRTEQQRRADCFADLLLGRLVCDQAGDESQEDLADLVATTAGDGEPDRRSEPGGPAAGPAAESSADAMSGADTDRPDSAHVAVAGTPWLPQQEADAVEGGQSLAPTVGDLNGGGGWLEVEDIDPDTGELLGTHWQRLDGDGQSVGEPADRAATVPMPTWRLRTQRRTLRIGVVVPLTSLLDLDDTPAELADRSAMIPAEELRQVISETLGPDNTGRDEVLFTRLLTDQGGRLLDTTELGRFASRRLAEAITIRAGTCRFPTCNVPADRCDLDHHEPWPHGRTSAANLDPLCRRHHRGKTFAWMASVRDRDAVDWTMPDDHRYRCVDEPFVMGAAVAKADCLAPSAVPAGAAREGALLE